MTITSPLDITWDHAYWVEGPEFLALYDISLNAGGLVVGSMSLGGAGVPPDFQFLTWPDEVGTADATIGASGPTWVGADPDFNNRPAARFQHGVLMESANYLSAITQPAEYVFIARNHGGSVDTGRVFVGLNMMQVQESSAGGQWRMYAGSALQGGTFDTDAHVVDAVWDATDQLIVDGSTVLSGNAGNQSMAKTSIGQGLGLGSFPTYSYAFIGIKDSTLTAGERSDLLAWSQGHYQTP